MNNTGKIYLICGKICSGKSYYAKELKNKYSGVILSTDEATFDLIENEQGDFYNVFAEKVNLYLRKKAAEICQAGANVILDWGFWTKKGRKEISEYLTAQHAPYEWHYIDIPDTVWMKNIEERNKKILDGNGGSDFFVDEGLLKKVSDLFEIPDPEKIDVWIQSDR